MLLWSRALLGATAEPLLRALSLLDVSPQPRRRLCHLVRGARAQFVLESGEAELARFRSSDHGTRSFCRRCGSSLFCESTHHPDQIDIVLANMQVRSTGRPSFTSTSTIGSIGSPSTTACRGSGPYGSGADQGRNRRLTEGPLSGDRLRAGCLGPDSAGRRCRRRGAICARPPRLCERAACAR